MSNMTGITNGAGGTNTSGGHGFTSFVSGLRIIQSLAVCVVFYGPLFVCLLAIGLSVL